MTAGVRFAVVADFGRFAADDLVKVAGLVVSLGHAHFLREKRARYGAHSCLSLRTEVAGREFSYPVRR